MGEIFQNLDLFSVGIAIAGTIILGVVVFLTDRESMTNKTFLGFSVVTAVWGAVNYLHYQTQNPIFALWFLRLVFFSALWQAFTAFQLFYVFPKKKITFGKIYRFILVPVVICVSILTLSPLVSSEVTGFSAEGVPENTKGPGIMVFGLVAIGLIIGALYWIFKKMRSLDQSIKKQLYTMLLGMILMFGLIIPLNFIFPVFLEDFRFLPLSGLFTFPFIIFAAYAILKQRLLGVKVIATEILTFILAVVTFAEIIFANDTGIVLFRSGVFILVLSFGILLIRSVRKEVEQRERLEKITKDLEAANVELKRLDDFRKQVLSFASHDLKAPISLMKQSATLIYDGTYKDEQKIRDTAFKIKMFADRGVNMIDNFLDIRKMEEGKLEYNFEKKNVVEFAKNITNDFALLARQKDIDVTFDSPVQDIQSEIDTDKMRQVFQNLLDNSLKYTEQGSVRVSMTEEQNTVLFKIQDTGIGMTKELLPVLFEQFKRAAEVEKTIKGTGLGLYISKQIVLAHHGEIWAESEGVGKGSSFFVRLEKA